MLTFASAMNELQSSEAFSRLQFFRSEVQFETAQLNNRISAFLTAQSFLLITYGSAMNNSHPDWGMWFRLVAPLIFAALGVALAVNIRPSIQASLEVITHWHVKQQNVIDGHEELSAYNVNAGDGITEDSVSTYKGRRYALITLTIMIGAWLVLGAVSVTMFALGQG